MLATATRPFGEMTVNGSLTARTVLSRPIDATEDSMATFWSTSEPEATWNTTSPVAAPEDTAVDWPVCAWRRSAPIWADELGRLKVALYDPFRVELPIVTPASTSSQAATTSQRHLALQAPRRQNQPRFGGSED